MMPPSPKRVGFDQVTTSPTENVAPRHVGYDEVQHFAEGVTMVYLVRVHVLKNMVKHFQSETSIDCVR